MSPSHMKRRSWSSLYYNARMTSSDLGEELSCSICLDRYTEPVSLPCGHNFCQCCLGRVLDSQEGGGVYSCPECRAEFLERPPLEKNRKLCNIVERYGMSRANPEKNAVQCTYCHSPAARTCLQCEAALCRKHLGRHSKSAEHFLIDPKTPAQAVTCPAHHKTLGYYCVDDGACVCVSCFAAGEHRGHLVQPIHQALREASEQLRWVLESLTLEKDGWEKGLLKMKEHVEKTEASAREVAGTVSGLLEEVREELDLLEERVLGEVARQAEQIKAQVARQVQQMEEKLEQRSREIQRIRDLSSPEHPFSILKGQKLDVFEAVPGGGRSPAIGDVNEGLISDMLHKGLSDLVTNLSKRLHLGEASPLLMDANTAHNKMALSADFKTAADSETKHRRLESPLRFTVYNQALSTKGFTEGQHYWEVETSCSGMWDVGLSYPSIERDGLRSGIGNNEKSWCLRKYTRKYMAAYNSKAHSLLYEQRSPLIGIYLDYRAGRLSFYELCDPARRLYKLLHTFTATFTEPLHAAVYVDDGAWVTIK